MSRSLSLFDDPLPVVNESFKIHGTVEVPHRVTLDIPDCRVRWILPCASLRDRLGVRGRRRGRACAVRVYRVAAGEDDVFWCGECTLGLDGVCCAMLF